MHWLTTFVTTRWYWAVLALLGFALEGVALYFQYVMGDEPCQVCIHVRIWVAGFTLLGLILALLPRWRPLDIAANLVLIVCAGGMLERSWYLYQLENGIGQGSCQFFLGFPDWFALDQWFPLLFEVRNLCGYTPELALGVSMAEALIVAAGGLLLTAALATISLATPSSAAD